MVYRKEIDGLRALAVLPVILFHAGIDAFRGGFVGVDVFFVISGFLITQIIVNDLEQGRFSIVRFYERRARRILPALFVVMFASTVAGYFLLMPDEFKNLGQSLVATALFSNNMLLGLTSGYWDLASEFKPLLHTWSLGVEEQYYVLIPLLFMVAWKYSRASISWLLAGVFLSSFAFAAWFVTISPKWAFYLLPTRAWEIALGGLTAILMRTHSDFARNSTASNVLSLIGLLLIASSVAVFDETIPSPSFFLLVPAVGAALVLAFGVEGTLVYRLIAHRIIVLCGLISYSLYLWHQPVFAYLRIYASHELHDVYFLAAIPAVFVLAFLSWKLIETPFRNQQRISRRLIFAASLAGSIALVACGLLLHKTYGLPARAFDAGISISDIDKRTYNERAFSFHADTFASDGRKRLLILGNSFARDFINMTVETLDWRKVDMVYRSDFTQCFLPYQNDQAEKLLSQADAIVISSDVYKADCWEQDIAYAKSRAKTIYIVGVKDFGYNLNWLIRLPESSRATQHNTISPKSAETERKMQAAIPPDIFVSVLSPTVDGTKIPVTDNEGRLLSADRAHLTKYGAIYFGNKVLASHSYAQMFR